MYPCFVNIFQCISNKMKLSTVYLYLETALHVSGGTSTRHQERIQLYLQHLVFVTPLLLESSWNVMADGDARVEEVKGKQANGVGTQYSSHYLGTWYIQHYYRWYAQLSCQSTELTFPADLNGLVCFAERRNLVSSRVPSHFECSLPAAIVDKLESFHDSGR
jgi:hypothetical protein